MRKQVLSFLVVAHFFLPYVFGTRIRVEVVLAYVCLALLPFMYRSLRREHLALLVTAIASAIWCLVRVAPANQSVTDRIAEFTNYTFVLSAFATYVVFRPLLGTFEQLVQHVLILSIPINVIAVLQSLDASTAFNSEVFRLYGGYNTSSFQQVATYAEVMVKLAGRCTSIFNSNSSLALFNVMVLTYAFDATANRGTSTFVRVTTFAASALALVGGVLAASKSFVFGVAVAVLALLIMGRLRVVIVVGLAAVVAALSIPRVLEEATTTDTALVYIETAQHPSFDNTLASRFGAGGFLRSTVETVFSDPAILAVGAGPDDPSLGQGDNAYLPLIVVGGIPFLLLFCSSIWTLLRTGLRSLRTSDPRAPPVTALLVAFLGIGAGVPTFETGRITPLLLLLTYVALWRSGADAAAVDAGETHESAGADALQLREAAASRRKVTSPG